nr:monofunctional biosynthetic peptidoglycan transglycosylase [Thiocapsa sp. KS1]
MKDNEQGPETTEVETGVAPGSPATPRGQTPQPRVFRIEPVGHNRHPLNRVGRLLLKGLGNLLLFSILLVLTLRWLDPPASAFMLRHAYNLWRLDQSPPFYHQTWVPWDRISLPTRLAAIAGEDQRFPTHLGFDLTEIRLAWTDYKNGGRLRGASTITQQAAKNLFLWPGSDLPRKLLEAWFTLLMEILWPKERILEVYLNIVQFSPNTYGIGAASLRYFGRPASELTMREASLLIGVLPAPGHYRLDRPSERLERRAAWITDQASRLGGTRYLNRL